VALSGSSEHITLKTLVKEGWHRQPIPVVEIPGSHEPEKYVLLQGHYDSWDVGVGDNATGAAALLEIARILHERRGSMRRSVRIAWWPGHSTGKFAGSTWYADHFALDLDENCIAHINCDSPGCRDATEYCELAWTAEAEGYARAAIKRATGLDCEGGSPHRGADYSFDGIGITGLLQQSSIIPEATRQERGLYAVGGCGGNIEWHTEADLLDVADKNNLARDIRMYLAVVFGIADAEILPFDWRVSVRSLQKTVEGYQAKLGSWCDLTPVSSALTILLEKIEHFYEQCRRGKVSPDRANRVIIQLARLLVPLHHRRDEGFRHDPALATPALPSLAVAFQDLTLLRDENMLFVRTEIIRRQNRLCHVLKTATGLLGGG